MTDYENLFKRLMVMNNLGAYLTIADGHTWINIDEENEFHWELRNVILNSKIYGGISEAVDTFDAAIQLCGYDPLITYWHDDYHIGNGGVAQSRIDQVDDGKGFLN